MLSAVVAYKFEPPLSPDERAKLLTDNRSQRDAERGVREMIRGTARLDGQRNLIRVAIEEKHIARYPEEPEDVADENAQKPIVQITQEWLEAQVARAFENAKVAPTVAPYYVARRITARYDEELGTKLCALPRRMVDPNRIVSHVEQLGLRLPPRVTGTIARRVFLALKNRPGANGAGEANGKVDVEFCPECGQTFARGDKCRCS